MVGIQRQQFVGPHSPHLLTSSVSPRSSAKRITSCADLPALSASADIEPTFSTAIIPSLRQVEPSTSRISGFVADDCARSRLPDVALISSLAAAKLSLFGNVVHSALDFGRRRSILREGRNSSALLSSLSSKAWPHRI
jgi:hypothetical protein